MHFDEVQTEPRSVVIEDAVPSEKEAPAYEAKDFAVVAPRRSASSPSLFKDARTSPRSSPPLPVYEEEEDIYRYLSRSPPMYKDDEDVYEDVYDNISPLRSTRSFANEAIRSRRYSHEDVEPVSPLRPNKRKFADELYKDLSPIDSHTGYDEDLFDDEPLVSPATYGEDDSLSPLPQALYSSYNSSPLSWRSNRTSDLTMSTVATTLSHQPPKPEDDMYSSSSMRARSNNSCRDYECSFDFEDYFEKIQHEIDISDNRPDDNMLAQAGRIPIFDSDGKGRPFSSIYSGDTAIGEQQMVIFVRHFFCGVSAAPISFPCALTNVVPGMPGISQSLVEGDTILDLFLAAEADLDNHHRTRLTRTDQLLPQTYELPVPNLFRPNEATVSGTGHEVGAEARQESRLHEGHQQQGMGHEPGGRDEQHRRASQVPRWAHALGWRRIPLQRLRGRLVSSHEDVPGPRRD